MPLTFAHPAAVLPLARRLPFSALVVGSMAPDFLYFLRLAPRGHFGHTLPGLVLFCLPVGAAVLWAFHRLVKRPFVALLPAAMQERLVPAAERFRMATRGDAGRAAVALLVGAATHDVWDAFTHATGWGVARIPALARGVIALPASGTVVHGYTILQHASTAVGLLALAVAAARWWRSAPRVPVVPALAARLRASRLATLLGVPALLALAYATAVAGGSPRAFAARLIVSATTFLWIGLVGYGGWASRHRS